MQSQIHFNFFMEKKAFDEILLACVMEENQEARDPLLGILETIANYASTHHKVYSQMTNIHGRGVHTRILFL